MITPFPHWGNMGCVTSVPGIRLCISVSILRSTGCPIVTGIRRNLISAFLAVFLIRSTRTTFHAFAATVFVALAVRNNIWSAISTTNRMDANNIFLFASAALFRYRHSTLSAGTVQHENSIPEPVSRVNKKKQGPTPWKCGGFFPLDRGLGVWYNASPRRGHICYIII